MFGSLKIGAYLGIGAWNLGFTPLESSAIYGGHDKNK